MVKNRLKTDCVLFIWLLATAAGNIISQGTNIKYVATISYFMLIIFWIFSLRKEIPDDYIRRRLQAGGWLLAMIFVLRFVRYSNEDPVMLRRFMWYGYYIPVLITPILSLSISLYIGKRIYAKKIQMFLRVLAGILLVLVFTSDLHDLALRIWFEGGKEHASSGPVIYIIIAYYFILQLASFVIMLRKCRISAARRQWWLPLLVESVSVVCWGVYYAGGGSSPHLFGYSLYNIQEIYTMGFLSLWESCILIGLIPTTSLVNERNWIKEGIIRTVNGKLAEIGILFTDMWDKEEPEFCKDLINMSCLAAFVKRRANLELIADEDGYLSVSELAHSIRESFEYYTIKGVSVGYEETGNADVPALLIICAYELFEQVISAGELNACYVKVQILDESSKIGFRMTIETDISDIDIMDLSDRSWIDPSLLERLDAVITVSDNDDTKCFELKADYSLRRNPISTLKPSHRKGESASYGLSGLADFLYLGKEALEEKTMIHDTLGRCLLMTKRYLVAPGEVKRESLFAEWGRAITDLEKEAGFVGFRDENEQFSLCLRQAEAMGIQVVVKGKLSFAPKVARVVDTAITVHITNILRHTAGRRAVITVVETKGGFEVELSTDHSVSRSRGKQVSTSHETGGLKNLRLSVEAIGGTMEVLDPDYTIILKLPWG